MLRVCSSRCMNVVLLVLSRLCSLMRVLGVGSRVVVRCLVVVWVVVLLGYCSCFFKIGVKCKKFCLLLMLLCCWSVCVFGCVSWDFYRLLWLMWI